jgi:hypothetical protein
MAEMQKERAEHDSATVIVRSAWAFHPEYPFSAQVCCDYSALQQYGNGKAETPVVS